MVNDRRNIYTINKLGIIKVNGNVLDESNPDSPDYIDYENMLRSGHGPTPETDSQEELEFAIANLRKRYSTLISAIPGTQEAIERVALGEESIPEEISLERDRLKTEFNKKRDNLINKFQERKSPKSK